MLKKVVITNCFGECMEYAIDGVQAENPSGLIITSIDGLGPVKADINMMDLATTDGQLYNSARLSGRNIVIKALFTHASSIEEARLLSYKYFPIKKKLKFHIETDERIGETEGYVESNEPDIFSSQSGCQISILCENPYFDGGEIVYNFNDTVPNFKFAFGNESLDERLIKISENATSDTERELIYNGDIDTGVELNFSLPTDDILDTFRITKIEVSQDDDKTMGLDMSKMNTLVPNTAPNQAKFSECSFVMDDTRCKYIPIIPERVLYAYPVILNDEYHCFYSNGSGDNILHHMKFNKKAMMWEKLADTTGTGGSEITWIVSLNNRAYKYLWGAHTIYVFNEETNNWDVANNRVYDGSSISRGHIAVAFGGVIHCFDVEDYGSSKRNTHHIFDGRYYEEASDVDEMRSVLSGNYLFGVAGSTYSEAMPIVYNNAIHILGGCNGQGGGESDRHFVFDGSSWSELTDAKLPYASRETKTTVVYHDKIHFFASRYVDGTVLYHHTWDPQNGWVLSYDTPYDFGSNETTHIVADSDYMYLLGLEDNLTVTYTEEANNIKLIENDQLVVNTNKGKKSVTLIRGSNEYNVLNILEKNPTWFELKRGTNFFSYDAEGGSLDNLKLAITTNKWYEGV